MTVLSPALDAAFAGSRVTMFGALKIEMPAGTYRLLDGSAEIDIDGETYRGLEPGFGSWDSIEEISDGFGDEAPSTSIGILPESDAAALAMTDPSVQRSPVTVMIGARDEATGMSIGDPYVPIRGIIDYPVHKIGQAATSVDFEIVSEMEYLMLNDEDRVMSSAFHHRVWPGETGMDHVTGVTENSYWGQNPPSGGVSTARGWRAIKQKLATAQDYRFST
ncbi:hypothetical protein SAMN05518849_101536 [Sphingobium sp. AP50]|uniref:hypothetical protein n=1 Tax=Sphingobium sp. AP50 TaxID=1884369 RepID=UPI0008AE0B72|nr:hypothetical protein [Sphingobium sp. AP50]SEI68023.1 hypothetical protein SAMN05518849_101536 [Sphingobium sp. AP50]